MTFTAGTTNATTRRTLPVKEMIDGLHDHKHLFKVAREQQDVLGAVHRL
jgi:hypothetical protein